MEPLSKFLPVFLILFCGLASPISAKSLWSTVPADSHDLIRTAFPLGNGRLGAMPFGPAGSETITLNLDRLWSGGPFEASVSLVGHSSLVRPK